MIRKFGKRSVAILLGVLLVVCMMAPSALAADIPVNSVTIQNRVDRLQEGETVQLTAEVEPADATNKTVLWSSSDPSILTVDENGVVTAVGQGKAVIMAQSQWDTVIFDTCPIEVIPKRTITTDKEVYAPNEEITVVFQTDLDVNSIELHDESDTNLQLVRIRSEIKDSYSKQWTAKIQLADEGNRTISILARVGNDYEEIGQFNVTIQAGGGGNTSEPETSTPETSQPESSDPETSQPESSDPDSSDLDPDSSNSQSSGASSSSKPSKPSSGASSSGSGKNPSTGESTPLFAIMGLAVVAGATMLILKKKERD